jgi:hypothetical protein
MHPDARAISEHVADLGLAVACCVAACGSDDALDPAALVERCGAAAPVEILPLAANELVGSYFVEHEDRLLVPILTFDRDIEDTHGWNIDWLAGGRVVSVGRCGEDPRVVLDLAAFVMPRFSESAPWLAQTQNEDVYWIDPTGHAGPQYVARGNFVAEHEGQAYLLLRSPDTQTAELARVITDGGTPMLETVLGDIADSSTWTQLLGGLSPGTTLARTPDGALLEVELATGVTTQLASAVEQYRAAWDSRFVVWRSERDPESVSLLPRWHLLDRETGTELELTTENDLWIDGIAATTRSSSTGMTQLWFLPGLEAHALEGSWSFRRAEDGRNVGSAWGSGAGLWIFDTPDGPPRRLAFSGVGTMDRVVGQDVLVVAGLGRGDLLRVPLNGAPAETVAVDVGPLKRLGDDRWATVRAHAGSSSGDLVVVGDGAARLVDQEVDDCFTGLNIFTDLTPAIFYEVRDHAEDRFGLYFVEVAR